MIYLDYNAAVPLKPAVLSATSEAMELVGFPRSAHRLGRMAKKRVEEARARVAAFVGANPSQVYFTAGDPLDAFQAARLARTESGLLTQASVDAAFALARPARVVLPLVDPATGVLQPVDLLAERAHKLGALTVIDAAGAAGRLPLDFQGLGCAALALAAHHIGGPQGCGALIVADGFAPLLGLRDRIDNVAGIVGFGVAAQLAIDDLRLMPLMSRWRDNLESVLKQTAGSDLCVIGEKTARVSTVSCLALRQASGEDQAKALDEAGLALGTRAGKVRVGGASFDGALALSFGWNTKAEELRRFADVWRAFYDRTLKASKSNAFAA